MKKEYRLKATIPEGIECDFVEGVFICKKEDLVLERKFSAKNLEIDIHENVLEFFCKKANKKDRSIVKTYFAHIQNMFKGLNEEFIYELEICHVHFPMTAKVDSNQVVISNFLGEKINRVAKILGGVTVEIKGPKVTVSGRDLEKTGQTAANIEKATIVPEKDRRVFQDGIFIVKKPGGLI